MSLGLMGSWVLESPLEMEVRRPRTERDGFQMLVLGGRRIDLCKVIECGGVLTKDGELRLKCSSAIQIEQNEHFLTLAQVDQAPFLQWLH